MTGPVTLPSVEAVAALPPEQVPAFALHLAALQTACAARLAADRPSPNSTVPVADRLLTVKEAAALLNMSADYLYRHRDRLPFARRVGTRTVRFSAAGIARWLAQRPR